MHRFCFNFHISNQYYTVAVCKLHMVKVGLIIYRAKEGQPSSLSNQSVFTLCALKVAWSGFSSIAIKLNCIVHTCANDMRVYVFSRTIYRDATAIYFVNE